MINYIKKKDSSGISYFRYIFCNQWDSNQPIPNRNANHYAIEHLQIYGVLISI